MDPFAKIEPILLREVDTIPIISNHPAPTVSPANLSQETIEDTFRQKPDVGNGVSPSEAVEISNTNVSKNTQPDQANLPSKTESKETSSENGDKSTEETSEKKPLIPPFILNMLSGMAAGKPELQELAKIISQFSEGKRPDTHTVSSAITDTLSALKKSGTSETETIPIFRPKRRKNRSGKEEIEDEECACEPGPRSRSTVYVGKNSETVDIPLNMIRAKKSATTKSFVNSKPFLQIIIGKWSFVVEKKGKDRYKVSYRQDVIFQKKILSGGELLNLIRTISSEVENSLHIGLLWNGQTLENLVLEETDRNKKTLKQSLRYFLVFI